jgi:hypothetical protein
LFFGRTIIKYWTSKYEALAVWADWED